MSAHAMPPALRRALLPLLAAVLICSAPDLRAQTAAPVKIGLMNDQTGPFADIGGAGSAQAARMAIEDFGGAVLGRRIELLTANDQNKPDVGVAAAMNWIDNDKIDAMVGGSVSSIALAVQEIMKKNKKPYLIAGSGSSDLTGKSCSPMTTQWSYDTYALPKATAAALVKQGLDTWYFITVDYAFGHQWEKDTTAFVTQFGGKVVGSVRHPLNTSDFASFLLQAQASKAKVVALANAGADFNNTVKQAKEFGLTDGGQKLAVLGTPINSIHAIGLEAAQGMQITTPFYWDMNDETRAWSKRYMAAMGGKAPNFIQSAVYSAVNHYLKAVKAAGTTEGDAVMAKMRAIPVDDFEMKNVPIRVDGQVMRPMFLATVKKPAESKAPYDYYTINATVAAENAWRPLAEGGCSLAQ